MKTIQDRSADGRGRVIEATMALGITVDPALIQAAMMELAAVWREDAAFFTAQKRKGHVTTSKELIQAAARLSGFAVGLTTRPVSAQFIDDALKAVAPANEALAALVIIDDPCPADSNGDGNCGRPTCPRCHPENQPVAVIPDPAASSILAGLAPLLDDACAHPADKLSTLKSGAVRCTLCGAEVPRPRTGDPTMDYLTGAVDTYEPTGAAPVTTPAADNPFTSPAAAGSNRAPVKRLTYAEMGPLIAATYPVPRPHLSHSFVESMELCGVKALLSDASKSGAIGPRRPSWSLIGGSAFHACVEGIERTAIQLGGASPLSPDDDPAAWQKLWEKTLNKLVDETTAALVGTAYANTATWHVANKGLEGYDWWRVQGLDMIQKYLAHHDNAWRSKHTLLQLPSDTANPDSPRVHVLEFPFAVHAGTTAIASEGKIDASWLSLDLDTYQQATLEVNDYKAGARVPTEHFQLTGYADVLRKHLPVNFALPIVGRYWLARKGIYTPPVPLPAQSTAGEIDYRYQAADRAMRNGVFAPSVSNFCGGCTAVDYCPAQSMRDAS